MATTTDEHGLLSIGEDPPRCGWCGGDPLYVSYHDHEWGRAVHDDVRLFEKLCLEGFQAGLSWLTILRKRDAFRSAFAGFDPAVIGRWGSTEVERLLADATIVRHRGKIEAAIHNARRALVLLDEVGSLDAHLWSFAPDPAPRRPLRLADVPTTTPEARALARDLKRRGWRFVGPTTAYAMMQSMGLIDDHLQGCAFGAR